MLTEKGVSHSFGGATVWGFSFILSIAAIGLAPVRAEDTPNKTPGTEGKDDLSDEERKIYGTWRVISINFDENTRFSKPYYHFARERVTQWFPGDDPSPAIYEGRPVIDGAAKPKRLDLLRNDYGVIFPGIYEWEGDKLKYCYVAGEELKSDKRGKAKIEAVRPKVFKVAPQGPLSRNSVLILERVKETIEVPVSKEK